MGEVRGTTLRLELRQKGEERRRNRGRGDSREGEMNNRNDDKQIEVRSHKEKSGAQERHLMGRNQKWKKKSNEARREVRQTGGEIRHEKEKSGGSDG